MTTTFATPSWRDDVEPEVEVIEHSKKLVKRLFPAIDLDLTCGNRFIERRLTHLDSIQRRLCERQQLHVIQFACLIED
jgi:hypothetical protein